MSETITLDDLLYLNTLIHGENFLFDYHMAHIKLVREYAIILNQRLGNEFDNHKLSIIAFAHDLFKGRSLDANRSLAWKGINIPQDMNRYIRMNIDVLDEYELGSYFNTDIQLHALAAGIFLKTNFGIEDEEVLYPIFFHSCPIIPVYECLSERLRSIVDLTILADKLSSNYLKINMRKVPVRVDLDLAVFGPSGKEFNYTTGLLLARMIAQGKSKEPNSVQSTDYYYKRLLEMNPFIPKSHTIKRLGGSAKWPLRNSLVLPTHCQISKTSSNDPESSNSNM